MSYKALFLSIAIAVFFIGFLGFGVYLNHSYPKETAIAASVIIGVGLLAAIVGGIYNYFKTIL